MRIFRCSCCADRSNSLVGRALATSHPLATQNTQDLALTAFSKEILMTTPLQETMQIVMQAQAIQHQFHKNLTDLFRLLVAELEESDLAYTPLLERGALWTSSVSPLLREAKSWQIKHLAMPLAPRDTDAPFLLLHISTDEQFSPTPELWLGVIRNLDNFGVEKYPYLDSLEYIFRDYFGPEETWTEPRTWYEDSIEDERVQADLAFYRIPLSALQDVFAVRKEICDPIQQYITKDDSTHHRSKSR